MNGLVVHKMTGSGNDFVFVDGRTAGSEGWTPELIRAVCARQTGVGADGFVVLEPGSGPGAVRFHFFNNDGQRAAMCGNAALCATRIAAHFELAPFDGMVLETDAGRYQTRCLSGPGEGAELVLGAVDWPSRPAVSLAGQERDAHLVQVGVPHLVVVVDDLKHLALLERGRALRFDPALGSAGANVNFVARQGSDGWAMRTYERGVEGETLACGTGAVACATVLVALGRSKLPIELRTASGCMLRVAGDAQDGKRFGDVRLQGEGRLVFRAALSTG